MFGRKTVCPGCDSAALEAARYHGSLFTDHAVTTVHRAPNAAITDPDQAVVGRSIEGMAGMRKIETPPLKWPSYDRMRGTRLFFASSRQVLRSAFRPRCGIVTASEHFPEPRSGIR